MYFYRIILVTGFVCAVSQINAQTEATEGEVKAADGKHHSILGTILRAGGNAKLTIADKADSVADTIKGGIKNIVHHKHNAVHKHVAKIRDHVNKTAVKTENIVANHITKTKNHVNKIVDHTKKTNNKIVGFLNDIAAASPAMANATAAAAEPAEPAEGKPRFEVTTASGKRITLTPEEFVKFANLYLKNPMDALDAIGGSEKASGDLSLSAGNTTSAGTGSGKSAGAGADAGAGRGPSADSGAGAGPGADTGAGAGADPGVGSGVDAGAGAGPDAGADPGTGSGVRGDPGTGSGVRGDVSAGTGSGSTK